MYIIEITVREWPLTDPIRHVEPSAPASATWTSRTVWRDTDGSGYRTTPRKALEQAATALAQNMPDREP